MTTHDQHTELSDPYDEAQPATGGAQPVTEPAAPRSCGPLTAPTESSLPQSESPPVSDQQNQSAAIGRTADPSTQRPYPPPRRSAGHGEPVPASYESSTERGPVRRRRARGTSRALGLCSGGVRRRSQGVRRRRRTAWCPIWSNSSRRFRRCAFRLEEQWARGEEASTEDLRVALQHYREFFQRLLAV